MKRSKSKIKNKKRLKYFIAAQLNFPADAGEREAREREWERNVVTNLMEMEDKSKETVWPRDTLFDFYCLMETLQENLGERAYILQLVKTSMIDLAGKSNSSGPVSMVWKVGNRKGWMLGRIGGELINFNIKHNRDRRRDVG